jgi:hypothetical protein
LPWLVSGAATFMEEMNMSQEVWRGEGDLRRFLIHFIADIGKTVCLLGGLIIFWEIIVLFRFLHYPDANLDALEKVHFAGTYCTLVVTGISFVLKQMVGLWEKKK